MQIIFKHHEDLTAYWCRTHPKLREIFAWLVPMLIKKNVRVVRVTAVFYRGGSGVHEALRAMDMRFYLDVEAKQEIFSLDYCGFANYINENWEYGSGGKPVALYHDAGTGGHIHLQVCDQTIRRGGVSPPT